MSHNFERFENPAYHGIIWTALKYKVSAGPGGHNPNSIPQHIQNYSGIFCYSATWRSIHRTIFVHEEAGGWRKDWGQYRMGPDEVHKIGVVGGTPPLSAYFARYFIAASSDPNMKFMHRWDGATFESFIALSTPTLCNQVTLSGKKKKGKKLEMTLLVVAQIYHSSIACFFPKIMFHQTAPPGPGQVLERDIQIQKGWECFQVEGNSLRRGWESRTT
ncbi:hypothetical protein DFH07DRAFT_774012 [Mycena maculata]|uniref:Uncharacterized protein n=1 Tax=Mycena maculata TaxID=230809 RepID=A0AAD7NBC2_9AGAR|nr:hypothetical protein DFH07DRAFT_774012 [Mycena maculata]